MVAYLDDFKLMMIAIYFPLALLLVRQWRPIEALHA